jgi:hypothetical protein
MDTAGQGAAVAADTQGGESEQPNEALKVQQLLRSMGVEDWEPRVVNMLVDFIYKYTTDVVLDAEVLRVASRVTGNLAVFVFVVHRLTVEDLRASLRPTQVFISSTIQSLACGFATQPHF